MIREVGVSVYGRPLRRLPLFELFLLVTQDAAYVFKLRRRGVDIRTITETHGGQFSGHHARYVLRSRVHRAPGAATVLQHVGTGSEATR